MKHINNKKDGLYEIKPYLVLIFGIIGMLYSDPENKILFTLISKSCGLVLLFCAAKILLWRKDYREKYF